MPYMPQGATAAQRDAFAQRLAQHLFSPDARSGLMPLREAFARAGGFPNAHAAEVIIKQDSLWRNPLAGIGLTPAQAKQAYRFLGIHPEKLFEWAKHAWRAYRPLLASSPFDVDKARILLASLWGHHSWDDALRFDRSKYGESRNKIASLLRASSLDDLRAMALHNGNGNFRGLHIALGKTPDNQWLGISTRQALAHTLLMDDDRDRRYRVSIDWLTHRINCQDGVFLADASVDGKVSDGVIAAARAIDRQVNIIDLTKDAPVMPWLTLLNKQTLIELMVNLLDQNGDDAPTKGALVSWAIMAGSQAAGSWVNTSMIAPFMMTKALDDPRKNASFWKSDVGLQISYDFEEVKRAYDRLPSDWDKRMAPVRKLFSSQMVSDLPKYEFGRGITIFKLPFLLDRANAQHGKLVVSLANSLYRTWVSSTLGAPMHSDTIEEALHPRAPLETMPFFNVHVDVPVWCRSPGDATLLAQSRSMGSCLLRVGPANLTVHSNMSDETKATIGNLNTKIFHGPEKTVVIYRDELTEFEIDYTA